MEYKAAYKNHSSVDFFALLTMGTDKKPKGLKHLQDVNMDSSVFFTYTFSSTEREKLFQALETSISPYKDPINFINEIKSKIRTNTLPEQFIELCQKASKADLNESPALILKNCPIDKKLPVFDTKDPVNSKYKLKSTFIAEAFLSAFAELTGSYPLGYRTINNGDLFHEIYPKQGLLDSQSQKSLITLGFHNDLPNNLARPDWVNILCLRNSSLNRVSTTVIRNKDVISSLSKETLHTLSLPIFFTPHEVVSVHGGRNKEGIEHKPIYNENSKSPLCYFETRTKSISEDGCSAIEELDKVLHRVKKTVFLDPGDFVSIANNHSLHAREVLHVGDPEGHSQRWLSKTFNVNNIKNHESLFMKDRFMVVDE